MPLYPLLPQDLRKRPALLDLAINNDAVLRHVSAPAAEGLPRAWTVPWPAAFWGAQTTAARASLYLYLGETA